MKYFSINYRVLPTSSSLTDLLGKLMYLYEHGPHMESSLPNELIKPVSRKIQLKQYTSENSPTLHKPKQELTCQRQAN